MATRRTLPQSEYAKQRKNLLRICGMALKSVVDKYCFEGVLSDADPDVRNLLIILENILMHRCKSQGVKWFSEETPSFWPCVASLCSKLKRSCIPCIMEMGTSFSGLALGRVFLQMALMERRLSEYLAEMVSTESRHVMARTYEADAFMMKDEGAALPHMCLGLNAIDFSFCPKGEGLNYQYIPCIDFAPYLDFSPCSQAVLDDEHEQAVLSGEIQRTDTSTGVQDAKKQETDWKTRYQKLYLKFKDLAHQKNYAEEMLNLKQERIEKLEGELEIFRNDLDSEKVCHQRDVGSLQEVVMELQTQIRSGRERSVSDRRRLELYLTGLSTSGKFHEAIALEEMSNPRRLSLTSTNGTTYHRSPYGSLCDGVDSVREGVDALERLVCTPSQPTGGRERDSDSLRPLFGSASDLSL